MGDMQLDEMSASDLLALQKKINELLPEKIEAEKRALKKQLRLIEKYEQTNGHKKKATAHRLSGVKLEPKYRCPNTGETWCGRGLKPRWLSAAIKTGKTLEDFAIDGVGLNLPDELSDHD